MKDNYLTTIPRTVANLLPIVTRISHMRGISGKFIFPIITSFIGHKYGTHFGCIKKLRLCGQFDTKQSSLISGGRASHRLPFLGNACFVSRILANPLSISFGIVSKLGGHDDGLFVSCMKFAGYKPRI